MCSAHLACRWLRRFFWKAFFDRFFWTSVGPSCVALHRPREDGKEDCREDAADIGRHWVQNAPREVQIRSKMPPGPWDLPGRSWGDLGTPCSRGALEPGWPLGHPWRALGRSGARLGPSGLLFGGPWVASTGDVVRSGDGTQRNSAQINRNATPGNAPNYGQWLSLIHI